MSISVKRLKALLKGIPDKARVCAYEGEDIGISIEDGERYWFIRCRDTDEDDDYTDEDDGSDG